MQSISEDSSIKQIPLFEIQKTKHKHEYQEICEELAKVYGRQIWTLPSKPFFTEYKIRKAHEVCLKRNILTFGYLVGVLKKL